MGIRFRKSVSAGPFRLNISKSGVGASVGGKYCRYTKKAGGGTRTTYTVPGTGVSYVSDSSSHKSAKSSHTTSQRSSGSSSPRHTNPFIEAILCIFLGWAGAHRFYRKQYLLGVAYLLSLGLFGIGWIGDILLLICRIIPGLNSPGKKFVKPAAYALAFLFMLVVGSTGSGEPDPVETRPPAVQETSIATTPALTDPSETAAPTVVETTTPPATNETEKVPEAVPPVVPETEAPVETEPQAITYILNTSTRKFHRSGCRDIKKIKAENYGTYTGSREDLIAQDYKPCGHCNP